MDNEQIENPIKVYVKVNSNNEITDINSELFIQDFTGWVFYDEGYGDKYAHAQSQYFDKPLINDDGKYNFKYNDKKVVSNG